MIFVHELNETGRYNRNVILQGPVYNNQQREDLKKKKVRLIGKDVYV